MFLRLLVVRTHDADHFFGEDAGAGDTEAGFALALKQSENDRVSFDEDGRGVVFWQQFVDRFVEVQAEVGRGVQSALV